MLGLLTMIISKLVYLSIPLYIVKVMSNRSPITRYYFRLVIYVSCLSLCSVWGVLVSIAMTIAGRRFDINYVVARSFYLLAGKALGISFEVEGEHYLEKGSSVLVGNHQTMLDILYLGRCVKLTTKLV